MDSDYLVITASLPESFFLSCCQLEFLKDKFCFIKRKINR